MGQEQSVLHAPPTPELATFSNYQFFASYSQPALPTPYIVTDYSLNLVLFEGHMLVNDKILVIHDN